MDVFVIQSGGGFSKIATDPAALLQQVNTFFCNVNASNTPPVRIELAGYDTVNDDGAHLQYTGNHADAITDMAHLEGRLAAEKQFNQIQADAVRADCPLASAEYQRVSDARTTAVQQLRNMINECRDLGPACRRCSALPANAPRLDPEKAHCDRCASNGGTGVRMGEYCRSCVWSMGGFDAADSTKGQREGNNPLSTVSCNHMKPGADVEVRAKGNVRMQLFDGQCQFTCFQDSGSKSWITLIGAEGEVSRQPYCYGTNGGPKRTDFDQLDVTTGRGPWWSQKVKVPANGTSQVGLVFHGFAYNCDNDQNFSRREVVRDLQFEICEVGYCDQ